MEEVAGSSEPQAEPEAEELEKVYGKPREKEPADKVTAAKKKFRYQIPILTLHELDDTISKLLGTMVSVSFQTMLQASPRLLKGLRQLLTQRRVEIGDNPELPKGEREEEAPQEVANLQRNHGDLEDLEKAFAYIRLSLSDREGGEVMRSPPGTKSRKKRFRNDHRMYGKQGSNREHPGSWRGNPVCWKGRLDVKLIPPVRIHTVEHECWNDKGPSYEFGIAGEVTDLLRAKMDSFVAEPTASPYANWWFVFRKPNKTLRWIQDLQKLNAVTIRDASSLPQADLLAESHAGRSIYSLIDLYSGYDQLPLDVRDKPYTAMHTPVGQLQMQVTPMGFINAVPETERRMLAVAGDMFPEKCESYIDDNMIKGAQEKDETEVQPGIRRFVWDHLQDIKDLLRRFLVYNITASGPKSILAVPEFTILGFRCGAYGRKPDPAKNDKISQWSTPCARRRRYILDARDNLSGFVEAVALKKKTGRSVADWIEDFYLRHPFVRRFIADNETEFVNQEVLGMLKRLCVPIKLIEPYHPEANAPVERGHRTLKNTIAKLAADHLGNWPRYLQQAVFAENMIPKRTTGCIPAELWYGREIDFPVEALVPTWNRLDEDPQMTTDELIEARCQQILKNEEVMEDIANRVLDSRMRDKTRWDQVKNVRKEPLQVGEMVLLRNSALKSIWSGQLGKRFKGPYRVANRVGLNTFELEDLDGTGLKGPFPGQRLVRFLSRDPVEQWLQEAEDKETEEPQAKD
ncbi:hypothetical protein CBR_g55875 [Chara braunii]|uniref:Integrase catalytic domain-containing protein n=1 Tax=Chara braunii TaxID=69332 RepID=A0A388MDA0_CHABU|nr:hypothetical protein CBR_g55875 [Chara braunii]|eukprot:GBG92540.1 hypothetical protein CBR_g55875 [Chara braunii]